MCLYKCLICNKHFNEYKKYLEHSKKKSCQEYTENNIILNECNDITLFILFFA